MGCLAVITTVLLMIVMGWFGNLSGSLAVVWVWVWDTEMKMNEMDGVLESEHGFRDGIEYTQIVMTSWLECKCCTSVLLTSLHQVMMASSPNKY